MNRIEIPPGQEFFGNVVDLDIHMSDLKLILQKTEEIEFPEHEITNEGSSLVKLDFHEITRKSFIVTLLIALDDQFKTYCETLRRATGQKVKWNNLRGSALERFITYSEKMCGIQGVCDDSTRQLLSGLIEIRNCIVHNNSSIEGFSKKKAVQHFAKQMRGVEIEEGYISIDLAACNKCADIVFRFMEHAYRAAMEIFPYEH